MISFKQNKPNKIIALGLLCVITSGWAQDLTVWRLPSVPIPQDNPQSQAKIALGRQLAFDVRLSKGNNLSCASCHVPSAGGAGITPRGFGVKGELGRWAPSWDQSGYSTHLFWDGRADSLEQQTGALPGHKGPLSAEVEMANDDIPALVKKINAISGYQKQFQAVFGTDVTAEGIASAISAFERTLIANHSPFQEYVRGNQNALNAQAKRGFVVFTGKGLCTICHTAPLLTDNQFHNIGVPQVGPLSEDLGRYNVTHADGDKGRFKTPTLYNSGNLAFYMHDGAFGSLKEVIHHYNQGGNSSVPNQDPLLMPLHLTDQEQKDLISFLGSLSDPTLNQITAPELPQ
jgi:cytochrome c peroxidase